MPNVSEIKEFWIPLHGLTPPRSSLQPQDDTFDVETEDDSHTFFDMPDPLTSQPAPSAGKGHSQRVYHLSMHQSLHPPTSHRAQFTPCWMALLPHLSTSAALSTRALNILHRGVMPHLNKPVRLMDWIGGCGEHIWRDVISTIAKHGPGLRRFCWAARA